MRVVMEERWRICLWERKGLIILLGRFKRIRRLFRIRGMLSGKISEYLRLV
jgi:hypothetical protein